MNTITGTDSKMSTKTSTKTVAKKSETKTAPVAAPAPIVEKKGAAKKAAAAPVPVAQAVEAAAPVVPTTTVSEDIQALVAQLNTVRESAVAGIAALKKLDKRVARELKEARKRRRVKKEGDENKPSKPSVFTTPTLLSDGLATFLGKSKGTTMSPADVTKAMKVYVDEHKLKGDKHNINHDAKMWAALGMKTGEELSYKTLQKRLYSQYVKVPKA
jgi:chromatin remodeling complex protein RSC6